MSGDARPGARAMPQPRPDKEPLKCNVFEFARNLASTLSPIFPYVDEGAMVPTIAMFYGNPDGDYGFFMHDNTVDEVAIIFGGGGTIGKGATGLVRASARSHGVGNLLSDPTSPESFSLVTITQRQAVGERQHESIAFVCEKCSTELFRHNFDSTPPHRGKQAEEMGAVGHLETLTSSAYAASTFNASEELRTCPKCSHVSRPFPLGRWGWQRYAEQTEIVRKAYANLHDGTR
jgi:hypothetical protein